MDILFISLIILAFQNGGASSSCESTWSYMDQSPSSDRKHKLENHLVRNYTEVRSALECLSMCLRHSTDCESINYSERLLECHVNGDTKSGSPGDFVTDAMFDYYDPPSSSHWQDSQTYACTDAESCYNNADDCTEYCHPPWFRCTCKADFTGEQCTMSTHYDGIAATCKVYRDSGHTTSGVLTINPDGNGAFDVYCDMETDGGGWIVFQKRLDGSVEFYRPWSDYVNGFGSVAGEYWLGLDKLYRLAYTTRTLRIDLTDWGSSEYYATYSFYMHNSGDRYRGYFSGYAGNAGDSLSYHNGYRFSTYDLDSDNWGSNCASSYHGAWWYNACHHSNLNGKYIVGGSTSESATAAVWYYLHGHNYGMMETEMKLRY